VPPIAYFWIVIIVLMIDLTLRFSKLSVMLDEPAATAASDFTTPREGEHAVEESRN
jgi:hypothetical protein